MRPLLIDRTANSEAKSFTIQHMDSHSDFFWHCHKQLELVIVLSGSGTRFVGDDKSPIVKDEVVLLGQNLPHLWLFDNEPTSPEPEILIIHLDKELFSGCTNNLPELQPIHNLIHGSARGIIFNGVKASDIASQILEDTEPFLSLISMLEVLNILSRDQTQRTISSWIYHEFRDDVDSRLEAVYDFIFHNFQSRITLAELADIACMNPAAFCRYFKKVHNQTLTEFINEVRIGHASKLLIQNHSSISLVCFESGFSNIASFNRQFKQLKGMTPTEYMQCYAQSGIG
ncbi:MAG: AraC family transcriptional regulator [Cyclobacteriaceae bacterium]|nr:MAG: AraC family transcriptional regulator [Cyclobacteriaceae bacterium]